MSAPTFSIITPCLNAAATLPAALDSIRRQGYSEVEMVVVDGGSTDGTVALLEQMDDVRWISEPDDGLSDAMNKGLTMASGSVVGWLNADDEYFPGALQAVADAFTRNPAAEWVTGRCPIVDANGAEIRHAVTRYKNWLLDHYSRRLYLTQNFVSCPATFVRRDAWLAVGPVDVSLRYSMDYDLFLRLAARTDPVVLQHDLAVFRMVEGTLSMSGFDKQFAEHARCARRHGGDARLAVAANQAVSRGIVMAYTALRWNRQRRAA